MHDACSTGEAGKTSDAGKTGCRTQTNPDSAQRNREIARRKSKTSPTRVADGGASITHANSTLNMIHNMI